MKKVLLRITKQHYNHHQKHIQQSMQHTFNKKIKANITLTLVKLTILASGLLSGPLDNHPFLTIVM